MRMITQRVIISGAMVEVYRYEQPIICEPPCKGKGSGDSTKEERDHWRTRHKQQAFHRMLRLVNTNFLDGRRVRFLTLTFAQNIQSVEAANKLFKEFIQRLRYERGKDFRYIATIEFQDKYGRGAVHYHMLCDIGYIKHKDLEHIWGNGFVKVNLVKDGKHAAVYAGKYMRKGVLDERLRGKKSYWSSRNLEHPREEINDRVDEFLQQVKDREKEEYPERSYRSEYHGEVRYSKFFLKDYISPSTARQL